MSFLLLIIAIGVIVWLVKQSLAVGAVAGYTVAKEEAVNSVPKTVSVSDLWQMLEESILYVAYNILTKEMPRDKIGSEVVSWYREQKEMAEKSDNLVRAHATAVALNETANLFADSEAKNPFDMDTIVARMRMHTHSIANQIKALSNGNDLIPLTLYLSDKEDTYNELMRLPPYATFMQHCLQYSEELKGLRRPNLNH